MTKTTTEVAAIVPLSHKEAMLLQGLELERAVRLLGSLDEGEWGLATDCPAWDVRAMYQHVLGACEAGASLRENLHQMRRARAHRRRHGGPLETALSFVQVDERQELSPAQVVAWCSRRTEESAPAVPHAFDRSRNAFKLAVDRSGARSAGRLGYLIDVIYLTCGCTGSTPRVPSAGTRGAHGTHDGRIVAACRRVGRATMASFVLELTG